MNTSITIVEPMTVQEAELCLSAIGAHLESAASEAMELDRRMGWKALGYDDLRACLVDRLGRHGYRVVKLTEVKNNIALLSPMGEMPNDLRERHIRDSQLDKLPVSEQLEAYSIAKSIAATENRPLTTAHVTQAVAQVRTKATVFQSRYYVVSHMVVTGKITAEVGTQFVQALDSLLPKKRGYMLELMAKFELSSPALVVPIAMMFDRAVGHESAVLPEVLTGFLDGVPLKQATISDLNHANEEARRQHMSDEIERKRIEQPQIEAQMITIYKGDPGRTLKALRQVLGDEVYALRDLLLKE